MSPLRLPSLDIPDAEKRSYSEADVHSKLFEPDMNALGYPPRTSSQAEGDYFLEQGALAMRRLASKADRAAKGHYDGLYLIGNAPIMLVELKRFDALDTPAARAKAEKQLKDYALSSDFESAPPFLLLYCGRPDRTRFYRLRRLADGTLLDADPYEDLGPEPWEWERVRDLQLRGRFAQEVVDGDRLLSILLHYLDRIEDDVRAQVREAVRIAAADEVPPLLNPFGKQLVASAALLERMRQLYQNKVAEIGRADERSVTGEMVTQAALNYLNKVFFVALCEGRNLPGFYRILREFLPLGRSETSPTTAAVFMGLLRRRIHDSAGDWGRDDERAYRDLRGELTTDIRDHVIEQNNWWALIRVAFDLAGERFRLVYRDDALDVFHPDKNTLAELVYDLSTKDFSALTNRDVGDLYQRLLASRRRGTQGRSGRQRQRSRLGAFYTPQGDVDYMVRRLDLSRDSRVLDPCMGSGHFLEGLYEHLRELYRADGFTDEQAYEQIVGRQLHGGDIDTFATSLAAIRLFLLDERDTGVEPSLFVHDMLLHTPERPESALFSPEVLAAEGRERARPELAVAADPDRDAIADIDGIVFDAVVGNPPYGARKPAYKDRVYRRLYGARKQDVAAGSTGTGDADTYSMFFANAIERVREGGRICLITSDSFRTLTSHAALRRHILDRCRIVEILLTDTKHFEGVSFAFAGMAITTLEKCSDAAARRSNEMRLVDYVRDPKDYDSPPPGSVSTLRQEEYGQLAETPFFVGVPREIVRSVKASGRLSDVARGRQGLATADDKRFLAGIGGAASGLDQVVSAGELAGEVAAEERAHGIPASKPHWVPFAKGEGFGDYWSPPTVAIDWSEESVGELERRAAFKPRTPQKSVIRNRDFYFRPGLTYSVVSSGRVSARLLPEGCVFGHKGSAIFAEDEHVSELFVLGYLSSALATYLMKKMVNTTATADVGYVEKLPFRRPDADTHEAVTRSVEEIVARLQADPGAGIADLREAIDERIFELFEIRASRDAVRRFYEGVGRAEPADAQATSE